jgi:hypothetical protein
VLVRSLGLFCLLCATGSICSGAVVFSTFGPGQTYMSQGNICRH